MAESSDEEEGEAQEERRVRELKNGPEAVPHAAVEHAAARGQQQQQPQGSHPGPLQEGAGAACGGGVVFAVGADNRLEMVLLEPPGGSGAVKRLLVTGMHLTQCPYGSGSHSSSNSNGGAMAAGGLAGAACGASAAGGGAAPKLDLVTTGGAHTIELACEKDWAGLVVGLNALLLLLEQEGPEAAQRLEVMPLRQVAWAGAVTGVC
jgi:hypothetical protein